MIQHVLAIGIGLWLDRLIGDPPDWPHPVRWIGSLINRLKKRLNVPQYAFRNGFIMLFIVLVIVASAAISLAGSMPRTRRPAALKKLSNVPSLEPISTTNAPSGG